jgi:hypothetical protein
MENLKRLVKVGGSWILYQAGLVAWAPLTWKLADGERWAGFWYPIYNSLMVASEKLQGSDTRGPWGPIN